MAQTPTGRLLKLQLAVALLAAATVVFFFESNWVPVINRTILALPAKGAIEDGSLTWSRATPVRTAFNRFLWISIDPADALEPSEGADLQLELGRHQLRVRSLFGFLTVPYPNGYTIAVNRNEVEPWWGAWHPAVIVGLGAATVVGLFLTWNALAWIYSWPVRFISFYADRNLGWKGARHLSLAALLPGALFFTLAMLAYALWQLTLIQLLAAALLHLMLGWVYVLSSPFCLPRVTEPGKAPAGNPFAGSVDSGDRTDSPKKPENPFAG